MQDRLETLRNLAFTPDPAGSDLANATYLIDPNNLMSMVYPANGSDFAKTKATEIVTISNYDTASKRPISGTGFTITRPPGATVTPLITARSSLATVVLVNVTYTWNMLGGRPGSEQTETIIASGTKK